MQRVEIPTRHRWINSANRLAVYTESRLLCDKSIDRATFSAKKNNKGSSLSARARKIRRNRSSGGIPSVFSWASFIHREDAKHQTGMLQKLLSVLNEIKGEEGHVRDAMIAICSSLLTGRIFSGDSVIPAKENIPYPTAEQISDALMSDLAETSAVALGGYMLLRMFWWGVAHLGRDR